MNRPHPADHEARLIDVLAESDDALRAFEGSELAPCAECRAELEQALGLARRLDVAGRDERAAVSAAMEMGAVAGESEAVSNLLQTGLAAESSGPGRTPDTTEATTTGAVVRLVLAAAAVFLAMLYLVRLPEETGPGPGVLLGNDAIQLVAPRGRVEEFTRFQWRAELPRGSKFVVRVRAANDPEAAWSQSSRLKVEEWTPSASQRDTWPDEIEWEVRVLDAFGAVTHTSARERCWRSPD